MKGRSEAEVLSGVLAYLETRVDVCFWRANTGAIKLEGRYLKFGLPGAADIQGVQAPQGRFFGIEVKREVGGKVSELQKAWGAMVESAGGLYVVASNVPIVIVSLGVVRGRVNRLSTGRVYPR